MAKPVTYDPPRRIGRWMIEATCPACGGVLAHKADGRPSPTSARALAFCTSCLAVWAAEITLSFAGRQRPQPLAVARG